MQPAVTAGLHVPARRRDPIVLTAAILVGLALFCSMPMHTLLSGKNDFVHWYVGGLLFGTPWIHVEAVNQQKQIQLIGGILEHSFFIRPTFYGLLLKPLTWFPFRTAYLLYQIYSLGCIVFFLRVYTRVMPDLLIYACISIPLMANMVNGQDVSTLLLVCTVSLLLAGKKRDFASGLVFALCAIKFHLFILTPVAMLAHRRFRMFAGAAVGEVALFLAGLTGGGWPVFLSLVRLLRQPDHHPYPDVMPNLRGLNWAVTGGNTIVLGALFVITGAVAVYLIITAASYERAFAFALAGGLLINFHEYVQDPSLLLLCAPLLLDGSESTLFRRTLIFLLLPVSYILLLYKPPLSATFPALLLVLLLIAVRDRWRRPLPALVPA